MECPQCGSADTGVIDSRPSKDAIRRRRTCASCEHRFTTYERIAELEPAVVKRDERREVFQPDKIRHGIRLAAAKRPFPESEIEAIVESVRTRAVQTGRAEIASTTLGEWVWEQLHDLDRVTAFRFAAVFRRPDDLDALRRELAMNDRHRPAAATAVPQPRLPGISSDGDAIHPADSAGSPPRDHVAVPSPAETPAEGAAEGTTQPSARSTPLPAAAAD